MTKNHGKTGYNIWNFKTIFLISAVVICLTGCGTDLSRSKAKEIILKHSKYPIAVNMGIPLGICSGLRVGDDVAKRDTNKYCLRAVTNKNWLTLLKDKGLITLFIADDAYNTHVDRIGFVKIELTEEGKKYVVAEGQTAMYTFLKTSKIKYADIKMAQQDFLDITGIKLSGDNKKAIVEYTWKYSSQTPFAKGTEFDDITPKQATVTLVLYDDGWRIGDEVE